MKADPATGRSQTPSALLTRPLDLAARIEAPRSRVDAVAFADIGLIAVIALFFSQSFLFSPGVAIDLPVPEDTEAVVGVRADAVATVWQGEVITVLGAYPFSRAEAAMDALVAETVTTEPILLVLVDRSTSLDQLATIFETARRAGFASVQMAARDPEPGAYGVFQQ